MAERVLAGKTEVMVLCEGIALDESHAIVRLMPHLEVHPDS